MKLPQSVASEYGATRPDQFGGIFMDGPDLVVLFTGDLEEHRRVLSSTIDSRQPFRVELTDRTWLSLEAARDQVIERLHVAPDTGWVLSIGLAVRNRRFAALVLASGDESVRRQLIEMAAPEPIEIDLHPPGTRVVSRRD